MLCMQRGLTIRYRFGVARRYAPADGSSTVASGVTSHRQHRQCRAAQGPKTLKIAQSDPNYVSRLLLDCVPVFHEIITPA